MTPTETAALLRRYNEWRRGYLKGQPMPVPREIGEAIDAAVEMIGRLEAAEKAVNEAYQRGYETGQEEVEKERDALRAKIAEMERQEPYCWTTSPPTGQFCRYKSEVERWVSNGWNVVPLYALPGAQPAPSASEDGLPDRDSARPAEQQGLFRKFVVRRTDGSDAPGGKHYGCRYFVLDVDHDKHAVAALTAYAKACETTHPDLAKDLREKWGAQPAPSVPEGWLSVPERLVDMFCGAADNLGDMPISEAWAERWSNEASDLLEKHNYFSKHAAPKPEGE